MPNPYRLIVPRAVYETLIRHARQDFPAECCGLLAGRFDGANAWAEQYFPLLNVAADPTRRYQADVRSLLAVHQAMRESGWREVAVVHSHPHSPPVPSRTDLAQNAYGDALVHLIVSLRQDPPEVRVWRLLPDRFVPADWTLLDGPGT